MTAGSVVMLLGWGDNDLRGVFKNGHMGVINFADYGGVVLECCDLNNSQGQEEKNGCLFPSTD